MLCYNYIKDHQQLLRIMTYPEIYLCPSPGVSKYMGTRRILSTQQHIYAAYFLDPSARAGAPLLHSHYSCFFFFLFFFSGV